MMIINTGNLSNGIFLTVMLATKPRVFDTADNNLKNEMWYKNFDTKMQLQSIQRFLHIFIRFKCEIPSVYYKICSEYLQNRFTA